MISVILVTFDSRDRTEELLASLDKFSTCSDMVVIDNASTDGTLGLVELFVGEYPARRRVVRNPANRKCAAATNQAIKTVRSDLVCYLCASHSLVVREGWDREVERWMEAHPDVVMAGDAWDPGFGVKSGRYESGWHWTPGAVHVQGGAWVARRSVFDEAGFFDESVFPHDYMDVEFSHRLLSKGLKIASCPLFRAPAPSEGVADVGAAVYHFAPRSVRERVRRACGLSLLPPPDPRPLIFEVPPTSLARAALTEACRRHDIPLDEGVASQVDRAFMEASVRDLGGDVQVSLEGRRCVVFADGDEDVRDKFRMAGFRLVRQGDVSDMDDESDLKLDLACGAKCAPGFDGVDVVRANDRVKHVVNLFAFPWSFADASVSEIRCWHFIEHVPPVFWNPEPVGSSYADLAWTAHLTPYAIDSRSVDLLLKFFDEVYRILKPGGVVNLEVPHGHCDGTFQDPTHRRPIIPTFFAYLDKKWRETMGIDHAYGISCHFPYTDTEISATYTTEQEGKVSHLTEAARNDVVSKFWNVCTNLRVTLKKSAG